MPPNDKTGQPSSRKNKTRGQPLRSKGILSKLILLLLVLGLQRLRLWLQKYMENKSNMSTRTTMSDSSGCMVAIYNSQASMLFELSTQSAFPFNHLSPPMNNILLFFICLNDLAGWHHLCLASKLLFKQPFYC